MAMRKRIYEIIEVAKDNDRWSQAYDFFMIFVIFISLVPLTVKEQTAFLTMVDKVTACVFIVDYALRLMTADFKLKKGKWSFIRYPFTFMAIVDLCPFFPLLRLSTVGFVCLRCPVYFAPSEYFGSSSPSGIRKTLR